MTQWPESTPESSSNDPSLRDDASLQTSASMDGTSASGDNEPDPINGYNDLGETMGVDLLSTYHIAYIYPLGKLMDEIKEKTNRSAVPPTGMSC